MKPVNETIKKIAEVLRALGHPVRIQILLLLNNKKNRNISVTEIHENLGLTQSETSRHLIVLKNASILACTKQGANSYYFINDKDTFIQGMATCINKNAM